MIKFQFKIIVDKGGIKKTIKPFLSKTVSSLALILSVIALSTIIGLGIHFVLAANPTANPPAENVEPPITVSENKEIKEGTFVSENNIDAKGAVYSDNLIFSFGSIYADQNLTVENGQIFAPNQLWADELWGAHYSTGTELEAWCADGWYVKKVKLKLDSNGDPYRIEVGCASPFRTGGGAPGGGTSPEPVALDAGDDAYSAISGWYWTMYPPAGAY